MNRFLAMMLLLTAATGAVAADDSKFPREGKDSAEVIQGVRAAIPRLLSPGKPPLSTAEFDRGGRRVLLGWYCPTSGEATCRVVTYQYDTKLERWTLIREQRFHDTQDVSVELPLDQRLVLRDVRGKEIYREPAAE